MVNRPNELLGNFNGVTDGYDVVTVLRIARPHSVRTKTARRIESIIS